MTHVSRTPKQATGDLSSDEERRKRVKRTPELEIAIGVRIRAARIAASLSQTALGAAVGISFQQVQKYELGKDRVAASTLQGIAEALEVHPGSFFDDEMPVMAGSLSKVRQALKSADVLGQIRDPVVLKRLLALAMVLGEDDGKAAAQVDGPADADDGDR